MHRTLLLNATYEPLMVIGWQRAVTLVFLGKSDVLEEYNRVIASANHAIKVPSVLRLRERVRRVEPVIRFSRQNIYARDRYTCQYCSKRFPSSDLTYDHVIPRCRGGRTNWTNIVTCCVTCNRHKGNKDPHEVGMRLLNKPRRPRSLPHFHNGIEHHSPPESWAFYLSRG